MGAQDALTAAEVTEGGVVVRFADGHVARFLPIWLRDNAPGSRHPRTGQRLVEAASLPARPVVATLEVRGGASLWLRWADGPEHLLDGAFLRAHTDDDGSRAARDEAREPWGAGVELPAVRASALEAPASRRAWLERTLALGAGRVSGLPVEAGEVARFTERFGFVRETNYGRIFDVKSSADPNHLAYADVPLALHTDNPYREPVPGLQLLHCLVAADEGGHTVLADGLALAARLEAEAPEAFEILARTPVGFRFRDDTCDLRARRPLFEVDVAGRVQRVAFNDRSMAPLDLPEAEVEPFYTAYRRLDALTKDPEMQVRFRLEPGELLLFDNERVLHARTGFTGPRHLQGCYADRDAFESALRMLSPRDRP